MENRPMQIELSEKGKKAVSLIQRQMAIQDEIEKFVKEATDDQCVPSLQTVQAILSGEIIACAGSLSA